MSNKKISELPPFPGKDLAFEVQDRGIKAVDGLKFVQAESVMLIGLIQVVAELREELASVRQILTLRSRP